jgi:hypothetical protein
METRIEKKVIAIPFGELATAVSLKAIAQILENKNSEAATINHPLLSGPNNDSPNLVMVNFKSAVQNLTSGAAYMHQAHDTAQLKSTYSKEMKAPIKVYDTSVNFDQNPFNFLSSVQV